MSIVKKNIAPHGFTLIDMMVATAIIVTISVVMVVNFKSGKQRDELRAGGLFLVSLMHQAQANALAGRTASQVYPSGGWGVYFDISNQRVAVWGDDGDHIYRDGQEVPDSVDLYNLADYNIEYDPDIIVDYGSNPNSCDTALVELFFVYLPPEVGGHTLNECSPYNQGTFTITIRHPLISGKGMYLKGNIATGQASLGPIQDIP